MAELYTLPDGWEWKKLGDVTKFKQGSQIPINEQSTIYENGADRFIRIVDYTQNTDDIRYIKHNPKNTFVSSDEVIMVRYGNVGFVGRGIDGVLANNMFKVIPNGDYLSNDYIYKFLNSNIVQNIIVQSNNSSTMSAINFKLVSTIPFVLPPLEEQKRIVAKLDNLFAKIDKAIALHQKNIDEADIFMASVLNDVFVELNTNETIELKYITSKIGSGSTPRGGQKAYKNEGISLIRSMNVHDNGFRSKGLVFIDDEQANKLDNVTIKENDILLNITGASVARCCIVDKNYLPARVNQHVSIIRLEDKFIPNFLHYYIISPSVKSDLLFSSSGGATREAITKSMLEEFKVPKVSIVTQQKVVAYLDEISNKIEKIKQIQKEKMQSLKELKASILDKAFKGEL